MIPAFSVIFTGAMLWTAHTVCNNYSSIEKHLKSMLVKHVSCRINYSRLDELKRQCRRKQCLRNLAKECNESEYKTIYSRAMKSLQSALKQAIWVFINGTTGIRVVNPDATYSLHHSGCDGYHIIRNVIKVIWMSVIGSKIMSNISRLSNRIHTCSNVINNTVKHIFFTFWGWRPFHFLTVFHGPGREFSGTFGKWSQKICHIWRWSDMYDICVTLVGVS